MKTTQSILYILLTLNILLSVGLWFGYTTMRDTKESERVLRTQIAEENQKSEQLSSLNRIASVTKKEKEELEQFLYAPSDEDQIRFISTIEQMGTSTSGATVETLLLELTKLNPPTLRGDFSIKGTWSQAFHVLRLVEELPSRVVVNRFDMKGVGREDWSGTMKVELLGIKAMQ